MADKEYKAVTKKYDDDKKAKKRWQTSQELEKIRKEYFEKHGKKMPKPGKAKAKGKKGVFSGYKAMEKFSAEYWKQRELKKKTKKKKAEGAKMRDKKGK